MIEIESEIAGLPRDARTWSIVSLGTAFRWIPCDLCGSRVAPRESIRRVDGWVTVCLFAARCAQRRESRG